jgi:hypothetical protein
VKKSVQWEAIFLFVLMMGFFVCFFFFIQPETKDWKRTFLTCSSPSMEALKRMSKWNHI